jgi:putative ABC transport system substrate-binding protein
VIAFALDHQLISEVAKAAYPTPVVALIPSVAAGLVRNMARPEGNITGVTLDAGIEMQGKQLDLLRQAVPSISRVAYLSNVDDWNGAWGHAFLDAGEASGTSIIGAPVERSAGEPEFRKAFETMVQQSAQGLVFNGLPPNFNNRNLIADLALEYRLPSICWTIDTVERGHGLMSLQSTCRQPNRSDCGCHPRCSLRPTR